MSRQSIDGIVKPMQADKISRNELEKLRRAARHYQRFLKILGVLVLIAVLTLGTIFILRSHSKAPDPIPVSVQKSVNFPVYYPDTTKLPVGFSLDKKTISAKGDVLIMSINYGSGQIIISEQILPPSNALQQFYSQRIPLRNNLTTSVGQAAISALNNETFVSLPTAKTWIIITAPTNINQNQLKQVLQSITRD